MRIIQVIPNLGMGGAETMCETLSRDLYKTGNEVLVVSLYSDNTPISQRLENDGIRIEYLKKKRGLDFACLIKLRKLIKKFNPDIIHSHLYAIKYVYLSTLLLKIRRIHTIHNLAEKEAVSRDRKFNGMLYRTKKVLPVALSEIVRDSIAKEYKISRYSIPVVFNGIDLSKCIEKKDYSLHNPITFINVARFAAQKNHKRLIEAFALFSKTNENSKLLLLGDGELVDEIKKYAEHLNVYEKIIFKGYQNSPYEILNSSDVFILSSDYEGIPMTIIEAMGTSLPIISTNVGGISEIIENEYNGLLVKREADALAKAMTEIVCNAELRLKLGKNALSSSKWLSSKAMTDEYIKIYKGKENG